MSIRVTSWALNEAPVDQPVQVLILVAMSEYCNEDGTESRQSARTIASKARVSTRTVQRELKNLEAMGVIRRGDQSTAAHLPANRRPVVYDLAVEMHRGDNLSYQDSDTTSTTISDTTSEEPAEPATTSTTARYDTDDSLIRHGSRTNSPLTSPITNPLPSPTDDDAEFLRSLAPKPTQWDWLDQAWERSLRQSAEASGLVLEDVIDRYITAGSFGERPRPERLQQWIMLETASKRTGQDLLPKPITVNTDTPEGLAEAFEMFWAAFPKKERRIVAQAAFKAALARVDAATLITQAKGYARYVKQEGRDDQFVKDPGNWLNAERWTDKYPSGMGSLTHTAADD